MMGEQSSNVIELKSRSRAAAPGSEATPEPVDPAQLRMQLEALLFVASTPLKLSALAAAAATTEDQVEDVLLEMMQHFSEPSCGIVLERVASGWAFRASDGAREPLARLFAPQADTRLSPAAFETLSVIAYLQPISRPEIARIRGVSVDAAVTNLLDRGFIEEAGRRSETGAVQFRTTALFERAFGLSGMGELPGLDGFEPTDEDRERLREQLEQLAAARVD